MNEELRNTVLTGDAATVLATLPTAAVDCVVTSPPYPQARDYGVEGQLGMEPNVSAWVANLRRVFAELARVVKPTGAVWLNVADSYSRHARYGAPPKSALLAPERLLVALSDDGWIVRSKVIWHKRNGLPTSVRDRLANTYEHLFLLVRSRSYHFELDAVRVPHKTRGPRHARRAPTSPPTWAGPLAGTQAGLYRRRIGDLPGHPLGRNPGDVWSTATANCRGPHHAAFPVELVLRPIAATCPEAICGDCGQVWYRPQVVAGVVRPRSVDASRQPIMRMGRGQLRPGCQCGAGTRRGLVLDPFMGTGTTAVAARQLGRDFLGIELSPRFVALANERLRAEATS